MLTRIVIGLGVNPEVAGNAVVMIKVIGSMVAVIGGLWLSDLYLSH